MSAVDRAVESLIFKSSIRDVPATRQARADLLAAIEGERHKAWGEGRVAGILASHASDPPQANPHTPCAAPGARHDDTK